MPDGGAYLGTLLAEKLFPPSALTVTAWADEHRKLPRKSSAEYGQWRTSRMPFLAEIQDCLSVEHPCNECVLMKAIQVGGTEVGLNFVGYTIDHDPAPMMIVWPTTGLGKRNSRTRVAPMISECPSLRAKVAPERMRDSSNTAVMKEFPGGVLIIAGANSAVDLSSQAVAKLILDEVDKYMRDLDGEGDPVDQAEGRTATFWRHKIFKLSSPAVMSLSRIIKDFRKSDQRYFHVPCPRCGEFQRLKWDNLDWPEGKPRQAVYLCEQGCTIEERFKDDMLAAGKWVPTLPGWQLVDGIWRLPSDGIRVPGFQISGLYTPIGLGRTWGVHAERYVERKGDPARLKTWWHQTIGEPFDDSDELVDWEELSRRAEPYGLRDIPTGCLILTASVDVQKDRLEIVVRGFGAGGNRWTIDHHYILGDPLRDEIWDALDEYLDQPFTNRYGVSMRLSAVAVDAGYLQHEVTRYTRTRKSRRIYPVKGKEGIGRTPLSKPTKVDYKRNGATIKNGAELYIVGVDTLKQWFGARLAADSKHGIGFRQEHFSNELAQDFYRQLTSEAFDPDKRKFVLMDGRRNEALDCTNYAEAIAHHPLVGVQRMRDLQWQQLASMLEPHQGDLLSPSTNTPPPEQHRAPATPEAQASEVPSAPLAVGAPAVQASAPTWIEERPDWLD